MTLVEIPPQTETRTTGLPTDDETPFLSVVIASVNGLPCISECLEALHDQDTDVAFEVVVVDCTDLDTRAVIAAFPPRTVKLLSQPDRLSIPRLRAIGIARARGRVVAILEDHCLVSRSWMSRVEAIHGDGRLAFGGATVNGATKRLVDWAVFLVEYAPFMPPVPRGEVAGIAGSSAVYDRRVLDGVAPELEAELWEYFLHRRMAEQGVTFWSDPDLVVVHKKSFGVGEFLSQRYHYSRSFMAMRMTDAPAWRRAACALAATLLPLLVFARLVRTVFAKGDRRATFVAASPLIALFMIPYAWGEMVGAVAGPGDSLVRVE